MQKRCNSIANALELRLLCIKLLMCCWWFQIPEFDKLYSIYEPASITASMMSMTQCKRDITPLLTHWSYVSCALSYWCVVGDCRFQSLTSCIISTNLLVSPLVYYDVDDSMQKRCNSIANALELRLFCIKLSMCCWWFQIPEFDNLYSIYELASITACMLSMTQCKRDITPLLTHWSYVSCALSYQCVAGDFRFQSLTSCIVSTNVLVSLLAWCRWLNAKET